ncbi:hypothetical protein JDV02_009708 [Purpureocillium takamizusanense]|uniref:Ankyrin repeat protein n=1 Tax=Purpureocillium takamizusanense TaxID=2060973 RepID=A0A9Q8QT04_9HYPO|nr:uncharacterized protein JDV02_009708 [Purpureocillium takamizusanense]UNI23917.1 hypothetical protein JDV02_009708 [Purpureocillium takamizusanense]
MAPATAMDQMVHRLLNKPLKPKASKKKRDKLVPCTDTKTLLEFIHDGKHKEFRAAPDFASINNEDRLRLAEAIVARYQSCDPEDIDEDSDDSDDDGSGQETGMPTPPPSPPYQTREQWLEWLLEALSPDPRAGRNLAEELIKRMGIHESRQGPPEKHVHDQEVSHFYILQYVVENSHNLCYDQDEMKQTLFHIAAIHGAKTAIRVCLSVVSGCCDKPREHEPGCETVRRFLTTPDKGGFSPLGHAIARSKTPTVFTMMQLLGNTESDELRKFLREAITSTSGSNVDIIRELLTVRPLGDKRQYQKNIVEQEILQLAVIHFNPRVFEFLLAAGSAVLAGPDCSLVHYAVHMGRPEAAKYLLAKFPDLATRFHLHPDHVPAPSPSTAMSQSKVPMLAQGAGTASEVDEEKFSVLALYNGEDDELRDLIFETLMRKLPISEIREHLGGRTWTGKEISLDVTILAYDPHSLLAFLNSVRSDLSRLEDCARRQIAREAEETDEEPLQNIRLADMPIESLPYLDNNGIEFEPILKYVNIPFFTGRLGEKRTEAVSILQWLKIYKRVKRVFEITVDDCRYCPSTEEDIEMALQDLGVEHLDWRRTDLSIASIARVAKDLKTLHLYSSGSLAAIDHWLGPQGINSLKLERLYIHIIQASTPLMTPSVTGYDN